MVMKRPPILSPIEEPPSSKSFVISEICVKKGAVKTPENKKVDKTASRKQGFEILGLKAVLWRIWLRSAKIFCASASMRNCWTLSLRLPGGWNIAYNARDMSGSKEADNQQVFSEYVLTL